MATLTTVMLKRKNLISNLYDTNYCVYKSQAYNIEFIQTITIFRLRMSITRALKESDAAGACL